MDEPSCTAAFLQENIRIVLVQPQHSGNIGAALRAMNNTGLRDLFVVDAAGFDVQQARWMAPGCEHLFPHIRFCTSLSEALAGVHHAVGATARHRRSSHRILQPQELALETLEAHSEHVTAILFGREDFGLPTSALEFCEAILWIPTAEHASLNLSQAIMVTAYALFTQARHKGLPAHGRSLGGRGAPTTTAQHHNRAGQQETASLSEMEPVVQQMLELLEGVEYYKKGGLGKVALSLRGMLQRSRPTLRELQSIRGMTRQIERALEQPDAD